MSDLEKTTVIFFLIPLLWKERETHSDNEIFY